MTPEQTRLVADVVEFITEAQRYVGGQGELTDQQAAEVLAGLLERRGPACGGFGCASPSLSR